MNLLLADLQQGMGFSISFHWIRSNGILAPTRACFAQGWLINIGDVSSGLFVFFIAVHTYVCAVQGRKLEYKPFACMIVCTWVLALVLSALGPILFKDEYFVRAGAWCWASSKYEKERLLFHYIWVFLVQFGTIIIYAIVLFHLRKTLTMITPTAAQSNTYAKVDRAAKFMVLYPLVYIILTLPLSAGRMWSMAHQGESLSNGYYCSAGAFLASSGLFDALLYTLTRRALISSSSPGGPDTKNAKNATSDGLGWFKKGSVQSSTFRSGHDSWLPPSTVPGIVQTRTVTVSDKRASFTTRSLNTGSDDEVEMVQPNKDRPTHAFASLSREYTYRTQQQPDSQSQSNYYRRGSTDPILERSRSRPRATAQRRQFEHYAQGSDDFDEAAGVSNPTPPIGVARSTSKKEGSRGVGVNVMAMDSDNSDYSRRLSQDSELLPALQQGHEQHESGMRTFFRR